MIKAICWDMDGLIFNTEQIYRKSWESAADRQGFKIPNDVYLDFIGRQDWECEEKLFALSGNTLDMDQLRKDRKADFDRRLNSEIDFKPGFDELIKHAHAQGLKQALVTSSSLAEVQRNFAGTDYLDYFSAFVTAESVKRGKPEPDCYLLGCEKLGVEPSESYALEDSVNGIKAAKAAGCQPIMIPDLISPPADIQPLTRIFPSLSSVIDEIESLA